ncbi:hypothetical protein QA089_000875 [Meyerozyma guilliermondii]
MVVHNPNNWHWVDKNCLPWTKEYFQENVVNTSAESGDLKFVLDNVVSISGDCDVTQRKGKVLCIYDMKLEFSIAGTSASEEDKFSATIVVPEFVHDQDEDDYVFEIDSSDHKSEILRVFVPELKQKLIKFQSDLIEAHERDVQHATD